MYPRRIDGAAALSPSELAQLYVVGRAFDGVDRRAEDRVREMPLSKEAVNDGVDWDDGNLAAHMLSLAAVFDAGAHVFDVWVHHADAGCLFHQGTTALVAGRVQSTWMTPDLLAPYEHAALLDATLRSHGLY